MDNLTDKQIIAEMGNLELEMAGMQTRYIELQNELIVRGQQHEVGPEVHPHQESVEATNHSYHFIQTKTPDLSYQAMQGYLNSELAERGPMTASEERQFVHDSAMRASHSLADGFLPTNGMTKSQISERNENVQNNPILHEAVLYSMRRGLEDWSHDHNHSLSTEIMLTGQYEELRDEISNARYQSPAEAMAAANYFRGRADELNQMRESFAVDNPRLAERVPEMDLSEVQIHGLAAPEQRQEQEISR